VKATVAHVRLRLRLCLCLCLSLLTAPLAAPLSTRQRARRCPGVRHRHVANVE
jgi:hypothetical protein